MFYEYENTFYSCNELKAVMKVYIEYYNIQRITSKLKGSTSVEYRN